MNKAHKEAQNKKLFNDALSGYVHKAKAKENNSGGANGGASSGGHVPGGDDVEVVEQPVKKSRKKLTVAGAAASSGGEPPGGPRPPGAPRPCPANLDETAARALLPQRAGCTLYKSEKEHRYRVFYSWEGTRSSSSECWTNQSNQQLFVRLLSWVWDLHTQKTGEACPHIWNADLLVRGGNRAVVPTAPSSPR